MPSGQRSDVVRSPRFLAPIELGIVVAILVGERYLPVSKTPYLFVLAWISLRLRRLRWRDLGFERPRSWLMTLGVGVLAGLGMEALELFVTQPLLIRLTGRKPDFSEFFALHGNAKLLLIGFAFVWTLAAFGEEMVWRGYLMNRVAGLIGRTRNAWIVSLILVNAAFGVAHRYQGITGILDETLMGVLLGLIYLGTRRNLTAAIVAHGVADTVDLFLFFLGHYPGT
jgi:membrane protease YdiL (CAAX protease family)